MQKDNGKLHVPYASRREVVMYAALGCLNIALLAVLCHFVDSDAVFNAVAVTVLYL